jgi:hypothetical protein
MQGPPGCASLCERPLACHPAQMGDDDRVVLRSGWLVDALSSAPVPLISWFVIFRHGGIRGAAFVMVVFVGMTIPATSARASS